MIKFYIKNSYTTFETSDNGTLKILHDLLSYEPKNSAFLARKLKIKWKNIQSFLDVRNSRFLTGFLSLIIKTLKANDKDYEIFDLRKNPIISTCDHSLDGITLYDYQNRTVLDFFKSTRGIAKIATGGGKCLGKDTKILMYDGSIKKVQDVAVGDLLMGDDSTPRTVLSICSGREELFSVNQEKSKSYVVNKSHILSLMYITKDSTDNRVVDISVEDYLSLNQQEKQNLKAYSVPVEFEHKNVLVNPYLIGVSIFGKRRIACIDKLLKQFKPTDTESIPEDYLINSREVRLKLLAGIIDMVGKEKKDYCELRIKSEYMGRQIAFLIRSLGFLADAKIEKKNREYIYVCKIYSDISEVPVNFNKFTNNQNKELTRNFELKSIGIGDYYGFEIDGNKRFILEDCTVTHNTESAISIVKGLNVPTLFLTHRVNLLHQTRRRFEQRLPEFKGKIGIIGDSIFEPGFITIGTVQTIHSLIKSNPDKILPILQQYQLLIIDEAHRSGAKQFWETASHCENAYYRLALTATPFMKENLEEDLYLLGITGEIFTEVTNEELIDRGIIAKPFFKFFTIDQPKKIRSLKDWHQIYDIGITNNEFRNKIIANQALQLYKMDKRTMIITTQVKHGKILEKMIKEVGVNCVFLSGSTDTGTREKILKQLDSGELACLIATNIFDEGISINGINAIILAAGTKSAPALFQRTGRGLRTKEDGNYCIIIDFIDTQHPKLMQHSMKRYNLIKNEKGFHIL